VRLLYSLVGTAALLFLVGGVGTIAAFVAQLAPSTRQLFMVVFLAGLAPTLGLLLLALGIGVYHLYLTRVARRTPTGWLSSDGDPDAGGPAR
jgi:hypothetical protein